MMTETRAKAVLENVPDAVLFAVARERREQLRSELGPYATLKKMRRCKGCGEQMSTRALYAHKCSIPVSQR
jgi:hypothetical protein